VTLILRDMMILTSEWDDSGRLAYRLG